MKKAVLFLLILTGIACSPNSRGDQYPSAGTDAPNDFDWLSGSWERSNDQEGRTSFEHWVKNSNTEYTGLGCTLHAGDTIFKENLKLRKSDDMWNFEVWGVNENPTLFLLIAYTDSSFECVNNYNEFPKKIVYTLHDDVLHALISDEDTEIPFLFKKMPQNTETQR